MLEVGVAKSGQIRQKGGIALSVPTSIEQAKHINLNSRIGKVKLPDRLRAPESGNQVKSVLLHSNVVDELQEVKRILNDSYAL